jgi:hypothetical protein
MKTTSDSCVATADSNGVPYNVRLKRLRLLKGKTPEQMAASIGGAYYDWEDCDGDLNRTASLSELSRLAASFETQCRLLFEDGRGDMESTPPKQLCDRIRAYLAATNMNVAKFEDRVGFIIEPALRDPVEILEWNVDCLRFVCKEIGVNWLSALP